MDYVFSAADPKIEPIYFEIAAVIAFLTAMAALYDMGQGRLSKRQVISLTLLTTYVFLVFASTIFSRKPSDHYSYELMPFWSYREILKGSKTLLWEDILNVIMLLPIGIFLPILLEGRPRMPYRVILSGFFTSLLIESLQLILKKGLFEFDDIFHNTLGVAIGYGICWFIWGKWMSGDRKE
jgi:glycopeptide antibiotics resistance protein